MAWHPEILGARQKRVLDLIGPVLSDRGFYLAGGTAVALHLGHRRSADLDWFASEGLDDPHALGAELCEAGIPFQADQISTGTLHGSIRGVRVSLLRFRYPLLARLRKMPGRIRIAARPDLAAMKLSAVAQRGAKKDFADIYALAKSGYSLNRMLGMYQQKFDANDLFHVIYSLTYFADADHDRMPRMLWSDDWKTMKSTMRRWVYEIRN